MQLLRVLTILTKRLWIIGLSVVIVAGPAYLFSASIAPVYRATVTLQLDQGRDPTMDPYTYSGERAAKTYLHTLRSPVILKDVVEILQLNFGVATLAGMINVEQVRETQLIRVNVEDTNPPRAKEIADKVAEAFIRENGSRQRARFESGKRELDTQIAGLQKSIKDTQGQMAFLQSPRPTDDPFARTELAQLQSDLSRDIGTLNVLLRSAEEFRLAVARYTENVTVAIPAEVPTSPVRPNKLVNTVLGVISGLVLGMCVAYLLEYLDDTIKSGDEIQELLGTVQLGTVTRIPSKDVSARLITLSAPKSGGAEAFRALRTNVRFLMAARSLKALAVTSPNPSEGKSHTLANLAIVMAQAGTSVIVIDSDLRRPTLHKLFGLQNDNGLTNLLLDENLALDDCLQVSEVPNLQVLTSGAIPPNPSELLSLKRLEDIIEMSKSRADIVLCDTPPYPLVSDAAVLVSALDGVILLVSSGETRREAAVRTVKALGNIDGNVIGVVVNNFARFAGKYYYHHYYYYGNGDGNGKRHRQ